jgi:hypothetical protein
LAPSTKNLTYQPESIANAEINVYGHTW